MADALCGVVEGFYGAPWEQSLRLELIQWMGVWGLNAYMYAPKDDAKHRTHWRALYNAEECVKLQQLIKQCHDEAVQFIYAIAPGKDVIYTSDEDKEKLNSKLRQICELGCTSFAILFDDIPAALSAADAEKYNSPAHAHASATNEVLSYLKECNADLKSCLFCPTVYCASMADYDIEHNEYLNTIGEALHPDIDVFWTGPDIVSQTISIEHVQQVSKVLRRKPVLWDNLHANDYDMRRLYCGEYGSGRRKELKAHTEGVLLNPNCEFFANIIPLRTMASYFDMPCKGGEDRNAVSLFKHIAMQKRDQHGAVEDSDVSTECGQSGLSDDDIQLLMDVFCSPYELGTRARQYLETFKVLLKHYVRKGPRGEAAEGGEEEQDMIKLETSWRAEGKSISTLFEHMCAIPNRALLYSFYPYLWELNEERFLLDRFITHITTVGDIHP